MNIFHQDSKKRSRIPACKDFSTEISTHKIRLHCWRQVYTEPPGFEGTDDYCIQEGRYS